jgi:hypothetical protein
MLPIVTLIATTPRIEQLELHALPSIRKQLTTPSLVVVVSDRRSLVDSEKRAIRDQLPGINVLILDNEHSSGAAGCWNTGIKAILKIFDDCYVAIIDDDDDWRENHLKVCLDASEACSADVVISGINRVINNQVAGTNLPSRLHPEDFLRGNPGWQGSNTFIKASMLQLVGAFTDGLVSCNDRDLAIRVLSQPMANIRYTETATTFWNCNATPHALSAPGSPQKLRGCAQFLQLYERQMSELDRIAFFHRIEELFKWSMQDIEAEKLRLSFE